MNFYIKKLDDLNAEAWVEDFISFHSDWKVVSLAKIILKGGNHCLVDDIRTPFPYRGRGYASKIVNGLLKNFETVEPIGILPGSQGFWDKFGMVDALGKEVL